MALREILAALERVVVRRLKRDGILRREAGDRVLQDDYLEPQRINRA